MKMSEYQASLLPEFGKCSSSYTIYIKRTPILHEKYRQGGISALDIAVY